LPEADRRTVAIERGENLVPPSLPQPLPEELDAPVLIVVPDDISTGDMAPDGTIAMSVWSNIAECARFMFRRLDPGFYERARAEHGGIVVGGHNYGQGSSREQAALAPQYLGIRVIAARSFARIHRRNLIAVGIPPLIIDDGAYEDARAGQRWRIPGLAAAITAGADTVSAEVEGQPIELALDLTRNERAVLHAGGLIAYIGAGGRSPVGTEPN
jgi:aconitate hydratase